MELKPAKFDFISRWLHPRGIKKGVATIFILALIQGVGVLVYRTGGIKFVYSHSMYVPILLAAFMFRVPGGLAAGLIGGIVLGPFMPLDTTTGEMQQTINWIYRMGFFVLIGAFSGALIDLLDRHRTNISWLLSHDTNTQLPNQSALYQILDDLILVGDQQPISFLTVSVNNYFEISRTFGIEFADKLINAIAHRLRMLWSEGVPICQVRLYMFGVVLRGLVDVDIKRLTGALAEPFSIDGVPIFADVTIGHSIYPRHADNARNLVQRGLVAVHNGNQKGIAYSVYSPGNDDTSKENLKLIGKIPYALKNDEFELYYQPVVRSGDQTPDSVEALIRWNKPGDGLILPGRFLPQVEQTGLIHAITNWVLEAGIRQLHDWNQTGLDLALAINISIKNLYNPEFYAKLEALLKAYDVQAQKLSLEITETAFLYDVDEIAAHLQRIKSLGIRISMDDYGSGYTSIANLKRLPLDGIKIDQHLVRNLRTDPKDQEIIKAIVALSKKVNLAVVAEGVEDEETLEFLVGLGVDYLQGYSITRPLPAPGIVAWLEQSAHRLPGTASAISKN